MTILKFSQANRKLKKLYKVPELEKFISLERGGKRVYSFDLPAGHSCPFAKDCYSKVVDGKILDGKHTQFRCYAASQEVVYKGVFNLRKHNFDALTAIVRENKKMREPKKPGNHFSSTCFKMAAAISYNLPKNAGVIRIHSSGDFFNQDYFDAWLLVADENPTILFYAYTKSLKFWVNRIAHGDCCTNIPENFVLTASYGGKDDAMIDAHHLRYCKVVYSVKMAEIDNLPIDDDDSHAALPGSRNQSYAVLLHGTQPKNSTASIALSKLRFVA